MFQNLNGSQCELVRELYEQGRSGKEIMECDRTDLIKKRILTPDGRLTCSAISLLLVDPGHRKVVGVDNSVCIRHHF